MNKTDIRIGSCKQNLVSESVTVNRTWYQNQLLLTGPGIRISWCEQNLVSESVGVNKRYKYVKNTLGVS